MSISEAMSQMDENIEAIEAASIELERMSHRLNYWEQQLGLI